MNTGSKRRFWVFIPVLAVAIWITYVLLTGPGARGPDSQDSHATSVPSTHEVAPETHGIVAVSRPAVARVPMSSLPVTQAIDLGPEIVMLKELVNLYEPVPFDHKSHAKMAQMWDGCVTCHHRTPEASTRPTTQGSTRPTTLAISHPTTREQASSTTIPACKSCHVISATETDIHMPSLKGAYHRQCLNCHKEWMHGNACVICHKPRGEGSTIASTQPTRDDIVGRMHPPIPEPEQKLYKMRYTPADGGNVLFRHKEHTVRFGLRCVDCHRHDNCAHCHDPSGDKTEQKPVKPGMTWEASHGPCISCHQPDRCQHCHYKDDQPIPPSFTHAMTGQDLDKDHLNLGCPQCHSVLKIKAPPTCGDASCHPKGPVAFPKDLPGKKLTTQPAVATQPTTRRAKVRPGI